MLTDPPVTVAIDADDYHAKHVGWTDDGRQFFLTSPFQPAIGGLPGCEYLALYLFDPSGNLVESVIESFGPRDSIDPEAFRNREQALLDTLGDVSHNRIEVKPFCVRKFGIEFGLLLRQPEDDDDTWAIEVQPGNYMAFFAPWDSGDYDT